MSEKCDIAVIGDYIQDYDIFYNAKYTSDGQWVAKSRTVVARPGGAGAVEEILSACWPGLKTCLFHSLDNKASIKARHIVNNKVQFRNDEDYVNPINEGDASNLMKKISEREPSVIVISDYGKGTITPYLLTLIQKYAERRTTFIILDPHKSKSISEYTDFGIDAILPNRHEAGLTHATIDYANYYARKLTNHFPLVCLKLGADGIIAATREGAEHYKPDPIRITDACGAGDVVAATIAAETANRNPITWKDICIHACRNATEKCKVWGAVPPPSLVKRRPAQRDTVE